MHGIPPGFDPPIIVNEGHSGASTIGSAMIRDQLADAVQNALSNLGVDPVPDNFVVERPARREHGDWSTNACLLYTSPSPRDATLSRMPSSA